MNANTGSGYPLSLLIPGILLFATAVYLAVRDWRERGSLDGIRKVVGIPLGVIGFGVLWYAMCVLGVSAPHWLKNLLAVALLGTAFGYGFAYLVASAVNETRRRNAGSYLGYIGKSVIAACYLWFLSMTLIDALLNGPFEPAKRQLSSDLTWLSAIIGWGLTPVFLRRRMAGEGASEIGCAE